MSKAWICAMMLLSGVAIAGGAPPAIEAGTHWLIPDQPGQEIEVYVTGGDAVQGLEFCVRIGGGTAGPLIENIDILNGTVFADNNQGLYPGKYIDPRQAYLGTVTQDGTVAAAGLLAVLTLDTTGLWDGQYSLSLLDTVEGPTNFAGIAADIADGLLIAPEPASLVLLACGAGSVILGKRRRESAPRRQGKK